MRKTTDPSTLTNLLDISIGIIRLFGSERALSLLAVELTVKSERSPMKTSKKTITINLTRNDSKIASARGAASKPHSFHGGMTTTNLLFAKAGKPLQDRSETVAFMKVLMGQEQAVDGCNDGTSSAPRPQRPQLSNVHGAGLLLISDIPDSCRNKQGVVVGIDEAGRGSILGPMVYGAAFWNPCDEDRIPNDFNDSKQLSEDKRAMLLHKIMYDTPEMGFAVRVLHASEISRNMLRTESYNLNQMSHDAAAGIIEHLLEAGVQIGACFIDTVGNADHYKRRLQQEFPGIDFTVESKADAKYPPCSAGSVVAKNVRDRMMESFQYSEMSLKRDPKFGSGYPSDPVCKDWMENNQNCKVFGYPDVVRFSWNPAKKALERNAAPVLFQADIIDEDEEGEYCIGKKQQQTQMSAFLGKQDATRKRKRYPFFERNRLQVVNKLF